MRKGFYCLLALCPTLTLAQNVLFDFDNAPLHTSLPITLTAGDITAQLSATGQGFSIQRADTMGFTPAGFSGYCIYPNSVFAADLLISFSTSLTDFSILYAPEEYGCDTSATMRVTAYQDNTLVGTATTNAQAGTWPSEILQFHSAQPFNRVVVHYAAPPSGENWGPIFMVDNLLVTPVPTPMVLEQATILADGTFQFIFTHTPGAICKVLTSTNLALPAAGWSELGTATEISSGQYQFTDAGATDQPLRFYRVRSP